MRAFSGLAQASAYTMHLENESKCRCGCFLKGYGPLEVNLSDLKTCGELEPPV